MPGHVRQDLLQNIRQIAVVAILRTGGAHVRYAAGDMHDNVAIAACSVRGGRHQQGMRDAFQLINGSHAVMQQQDGGVWGKLRGQRLYRI